MSHFPSVLDVFGTLCYQIPSSECLKGWRMHGWKALLLMQNNTESPHENILQYRQWLAGFILVSTIPAVLPDIEILSRCDPWTKKSMTFGMFFQTCWVSMLYVIVINWRWGLYWFYRREARGRVVPEAEHLLNQYRPTAPVNKYFLDHARSNVARGYRAMHIAMAVCLARYSRATKTCLLVSVWDLPSLGNCMRFLPSLGYCMRIWPS